MFFYTKLFNKYLLRPSTKFYHNIFLLKQSLSFLFNHNLFTHIFLSTKNLKIKFFKTKHSLNSTKYVSALLIILLILVLILL